MDDGQREDLLSRLTLREKTRLLAGADRWHTVAIERPLGDHLGIPAIKMTDGPNGARGGDGNRSPSSACFPVGVALGATWNPRLIERVGAALAGETKEKGAHILLAPTVNIHRSPLAGRNFECYSEDPLLAGRIAAAYIRGLQQNGVGACIKHLVANDSEYQRFTISSEVAERPLREIYLTPFRIAIKEAGPWAVMSAYNRLNGTYCSENARLLLKILKGEWAFDGIVICDWHGTYSLRVAEGGLDLEMPGPGRFLGRRALEQVRSGALDEAVVDDKVRRLLRTIDRVGAFEEKRGSERAVDRPEDRALAREVAREGMVLLKNEAPAGEERPLLPLEVEQIETIAVIGENGLRAQIQGGGSAHVRPHYAVSPLQGIRRRTADHADVRYALGTPNHRNLPICDRQWLAAEDGAPGLTVRYYDNRALEGEPILTETTDRFSLAWFDDTDPLVDPDDFSLRLSGTFTPLQDGDYTFSLKSAGRSRLTLGSHTLIDNWPGDEAAPASEELRATATLEEGEALPLEVIYSPSPAVPGRSLRLGCLDALPEDPIAEAQALAATADVVVLVAGLGNEWESEGFDRADMSLPGAQSELIARVTEANPRTVVVLNSGAPVDMPWLDGVPALLQMWYPGQEAGNALADVLFGDADPGGRLPTTFPRRLQDNPAYVNYPGENGQVRYGEGLFVGYRYYDHKAIEPLFPFGHGLSYTAFVYHMLAIEQESFGPGDEIQVRVTLENVGRRIGQEVIQLYLRDVQATLLRPYKELKQFAKVTLQPGETLTVTLALSRDDLAYYDPVLRRWVAEAGEFEVLVGRSSADIRLRGKFRWWGDRPTSPEWHSRPLRELLDGPQTRQVLQTLLPDLLEQPRLTIFMELSLEALARMVPHLLPPGRLEAVVEALEATVEA